MVFQDKSWLVILNKINVTERYVLRLDRIRLEIKILKSARVAPIVEKLVENKLRWFGYVERRPVNFVVRRVD